LADGKTDGDWLGLLVGVVLGEDDEDGLSEGEVVGWGALVVVVVVVIVN
jgi:hypothetical protein